MVVIFHFSANSRSRFGGTCSSATTEWIEINHMYAKHSTLSNVKRPLNRMVWFQIGRRKTNEFMVIQISQSYAEKPLYFGAKIEYVYL